MNTKNALAQQVPADGEAVAWSVVGIGNRGEAYDGPKDCRAYTYQHQPGNLDASRLGSATHDAMNMSAGDSIDRGLCLLKALQAHGFGVFQLSAATPQAPQPVVGGEGAKPGVPHTWVDYRETCSVCGSRDFGSLCRQPQQGAVDDAMARRLMRALPLGCAGMVDVAAATHALTAALAAHGKGG